MTVLLTVSKLLGGVAPSDTLAGSGNGYDLGSAVNAQWAPIISKDLNTGWAAFYIRHNGVDPITLAATFISQYSQTYGGADTAANDFVTLKAKGAASSDAANNSDGDGGGLRVEHDADLGGTLGLTAFAGTRAQVKIYGRDDLGISLETAYEIHADAMIRNNAGTAVDASAPVAGSIGPTGSTTLGDTAFLKLRFYLEEDAESGGILQFDYVVRYSFTG